jgi:uncharacterized membrane protein
MKRNYPMNSCIVEKEESDLPTKKSLDEKSISESLTKEIQKIKDVGDPTRNKCIEMLLTALTGGSFHGGWL